MPEILATLFDLVNSADRCRKNSNAHNRDMRKDPKKPKIELVHIEEAAKLKALFKERAEVSQMRFGEDNELGTQGNVWQYLNARSPLNLEAALKFAKGLKCSISDFSPRLAASLQTDAGPSRISAGLVTAVASIASSPVLGALGSSTAHQVAASATTSAIDLASQAAEIGRMWLLLPEARRKRVKAALERELRHLTSENAVIPATEKSRENTTQLPDTTGHRTLFLDSVGEQKKSPEKDAGEG